MLRALLGRLPVLTTAGLSLLLSGCLTADVWQTAGTKEAYGAMEGVWTPRTGHPAALRRYTVGPQMGLTPDQHSYALLPLGADGRPAPPFGYDGPERVPSRIVAALDEGQILDITTTPPHWQTTGQARAILKSPDFHPVNGVPDGRRAVVPDGYGHRTFDFRSSPARPALQVIAFGPAASEPSQPVGSDEPLPAGSAIVVIPETATRPPPDRAASLGQALALTPLTVGFDAAMTVLSPVILVLYLFGVGHK